MAETTVAAAVVKGSDADAQKDDGSAKPVKRAEVGDKDKNALEEDTDHGEEGNNSSAKKLSKKGSSSGKSHKRQGDSKPPRAPTPYIIFSNDIRESIKQRNPDMKPTDIMKAIGEQWRNLPKEEKKTYEDKAEVEKAKLGLEQGNTDGPVSTHKDAIVAGFKETEEGDVEEIEQRTANGVLDLDDISAGSMLEVSFGL
ncbi:unnamed protein product [Closterium sp. Naga37s-1]|nr:unnamed protein product [Closterium sp. Naga37s-1]